MTSEQKLRLLLFNLCTDTDDPVLGFTTAWINALAAHCDFIDVVTMRAGRLALADNVRVFSVGKEHGYSEARRALNFYRIVIGLLLSRRYDACFAHMITLFAVMAGPLLWLWRIPMTLWYAHGAVTSKLKAAVFFSRRVVTSSQQGFRIDSPKTRVVGQGIDTNLFHPPPIPKAGNSFVIITAGRVSPVKNLEVLIDAANGLYGELGWGELQVVIVGAVAEEDSAYGEKLRGLVEALSLGKIIDFAGPVNHERVVREYQEADVMVNTSKTGSIDKAVLEAMACGLPVITSNEAFREMLSPWADWLFIPPDSPGKLITSLVRLRAMGMDERQNLGSELRALVAREHSLEQLTQRLVNVLSSGEMG